MDDTQEDRPVHLVVDCSPAIFDEQGILVPVENRITRTPLTDEEWAEHQQRSAEHAAELKAQEAEDEELREAVKNHPDPVVQALAKKLGMS